MDWEWVLRIAPSIAAVAGLGWWLSGQFHRVKQDLHNLLSLHEEKDQLRHESNLIRFEKISVALAKLGSDNGTHATTKKETN